MPAARGQAREQRQAAAARGGSVLRLVVEVGAGDDVGGERAHLAGDVVERARPDGQVRESGDGGVLDHVEVGGEDVGACRIPASTPGAKGRGGVRLGGGGSAQRALLEGGVGGDAGIVKAVGRAGEGGGEGSRLVGLHGEGSTGNDDGRAGPAPGHRPGVPGGARAAAVACPAWPACRGGPAPTGVRGGRVAGRRVAAGGRRPAGASRGSLPLAQQPAG